MQIYYALFFSRSQNYIMPIYGLHPIILFNFGLNYAKINQICTFYQKQSLNYINVFLKFSIKPQTST